MPNEVREQMRGRGMWIEMTGLIGVAFTLSGAGVVGLVFLWVLTAGVRRSIRVGSVEPESLETTAAMGTLIEEEA